MTSYAELKKKIDLLTRQAERTRRNELASVIKEVRRLISMHELTAEDLGLASQKQQSTGKKRKSFAKTPKLPKAKRTVVAPKYRDENGNFWTGRGKMPVWLRSAIEQGRSLESFLIPTDSR